MARAIHDLVRQHPARELSRTQARTAQRRLARTSAKNANRRVLLACELVSVTDPVANVGDHVWCDKHSEFARVVRVIA